HFVAERVRFRYNAIPVGDEGTWMEDAKEFAQGHGFTTRLLIAPFVKHPDLPRPDDLRFPGMIMALAAGFLMFGISYKTALWTAGILLLIKEVLLYYALRSFFGAMTALAALAVTVFSLNQLYWGTGVCAEGLFGIGVAALALWSKRLTKGSLIDWTVIGILMGILCIIRPNGVLFFAGLAALYWFTRKSPDYPRYGFLSACLAFALMMMPVLVRNALCFGSPFHLALSAGLLRGSLRDPWNYSLTEFLGKYGLLFPFKALIVGCWRFIPALDFHEHGLQWIPLAGVCLGVATRRTFYNSFIMVPIVVSFMASAYVAYIEWASVRYFTPFLPFVYAYGIYAIIATATPLRTKIKPAIMLYGAFFIFIGALLAPVFHPHRYYERFFKNPPAPVMNVRTHCDILTSELPENGVYCANQIAQLQFLTDKNCVGMYEDCFDSTNVSWVIDKFHPRLLVFTDAEFAQPGIRAIVREFNRRGYSVQKIRTNGIAGYYRVAPENSLLGRTE
ncbi:MAG: glycosyltransferase family 39 protein, partial [Chitinivibrionales bacterium]|nr:glycosyltransferase family 39 protein [Chitinivibrionales bacterium]